VQPSFRAASLSNARLSISLGSGSAIRSGTSSWSPTRARLLWLRGGFAEDKDQH
ncbi:hypothetical protein CORC01_11598, partial [Colletotrichum orchidophilum]